MNTAERDGLISLCERAASMQGVYLRVSSGKNKASKSVDFRVEPDAKGELPPGADVFLDLERRIDGQQYVDPCWVEVLATNGKRAIDSICVRPDEGAAYQATTDGAMASMAQALVTTNQDLRQGLMMTIRQNHQLLESAADWAYARGSIETEHAMLADQEQGDRMIEAMRLFAPLVTAGGMKLLKVGMSKRQAKQLTDGGGEENGTDEGDEGGGIDARAIIGDEAVEKLRALSPDHSHRMMTWLVCQMVVVGQEHPDTVTAELAGLLLDTFGEKVAAAMGFGT